ncbi:hypothetical protein [Micromonospora sp. KC213]|uniref:hypothetical protein n=1 Tax=Micromonospora sp. KC213 TaxID=2530378 RepID=UPI00104A0C9D|nr:hypothetical protein [Micromonospora sp. KC213]TDC28756.1 hypothetical protein E1166_30385 [Micromonospora sp. KC213]
MEVRKRTDGCAPGGGGGVVIARTSPADPTLCRGKSRKVRVAFVAGAVAGRLEVAGEVTTATGRFARRGADSSRVGGRAAASPAACLVSTVTDTPSATSIPVAATDVPTPAVLARRPEYRPGHRRCRRVPPEDP